MDTVTEPSTAMCFYFNHSTTETSLRLYKKDAQIEYIELTDIAVHSSIGVSGKQDLLITRAPDKKELQG